MRHRPRRSSDDNHGMLTRLSTFAVWAAVAACAVFWGLRLFVKPQPAPPQAAVAAVAAPVGSDLTRLLGADPVVVTAPTAVAVPDPRFRLLGVVSPRAARSADEGLALIAIDDRPPRAYRVGAVVEGQTVLQSVGPRGASLGPRGGVALVALELAPPAAAATRSLPPAMSPGAPPPLATLPGMPGSTGPALRRPPNLQQFPPSAVLPQQLPSLETEPAPEGNPAR
jgi:general secretion pathway protein C